MNTTSPATSYLHNEAPLKVLLNPYQQIFYNEWQLHPLRTDYNIIWDQELTGQLDLERLNNSIVRFVKEHLLFNSNVVQEADNTWWITRTPLSAQAKIVAYHASPLSAETLLQMALRPFDLENDLLIKADVIQVTADRYRLLIMIPHILMDGSTGYHFLTALGRYYNEPYFKNETSLAQQLDIYQQLSTGHREVIDQHHHDMHQFWQQHLQNTNGADLDFLKTETSKKNTGSKIGEYWFSLDKENARQLQQHTIKHKLTPFNFSQLVLAIAIYRMTRQENFGMTYPVAMWEGESRVYGAYVNSLLKAYHFDATTTLGDVINDATAYRKTLKESNAKYLPVHEIIGHAASHDLLQVAFSQTNLKNQALEFDGITHVHIHQELNIDLAYLLQFEQEFSNGILQYRIKYNKTILDETLVENFVSLFKQLLHAILQDLVQEHLDVPVNSYALLNSQQYQQIVYDWNATGKPYPHTTTIHQQFEAQVLRTPNNIAVTDAQQSLTYATLNQKANQLSAYLSEVHHISTGDLVALYLDRSVHMQIAILAVLKAGGAYVPIDPAYPDARTTYIFSDTSTKVVLTNQHYENNLYTLSDGVAVAAIDGDDLQAFLQDYLVINPEKKVSSKDLAYVIYTSGTTGKPKGVMLQHQGIINRIVWMNDQYPLSESDRILQKTPYVFDVSVWELTWALWYGASIVFAKPDGHKDNVYLATLIRSENITVLHFVPSMLSSFTETLEENVSLQQAVSGLKYLFCSGEALSLSQVKKAKTLLPHTQLHNLYGPTEASVDVLYYDCNDTNLNTVLIGRPIANTSMYILDEQLTPLPPGAAGELYIGGDGLATGYLNLPELTATRFISNPFQTPEEQLQQRNARLYKTGDLVKYLPDGNIAYIGRNDFQVKVRGYRIELGEIENRLTAYPTIKQAVVVAKQTGADAYLAGYYVAPSPLDHEILLNWIGQQLPEYMIPATLIHLQELPLTTNGKLDRNALPAIQLTDQRTYIAPETVTEQILSEVYAQVLKLPVSQIGVTDDFFRLGGNSILAIKLVNQVNKILQQQLTVNAVFTGRTIRNIGSQLRNAVPEAPPITAANAADEDIQPLSFAQERLWFIENYEGGSNAYNVPVVLQLLPGTRLENIIRSLKNIFHRHEILRSLIKTTSAGKGYQEVLDDHTDPLPVEILDVFSFASLEHVLTETINHVFDIAQEYPVHAKIFRLHTDHRETRYLSIVIHHIAFDGWSTDILLRELAAGYADDAAPAPLPLQYKDFARWQRQYLTGEILQQQLDYWKKELAGFEVLQLQTDKPRPAQISYAGAHINFTIDAALSEDLRNVARTLEVSLYSVLLSGYYLLLGSYSQQQDIVIGSPMANRHHRGTADLIGFFVNTLALRTQLTPSLSLPAFIRQVGAQVLSAQLHQDLPFEKLVEALALLPDTSRHPVFQVMFTVQDFGGGTAQEQELFTWHPAYEYYPVAKFDLSVMLDDSSAAIGGLFNYATGLFKTSTIEGYIRTYLKILQQIGALKTSRTVPTIKDLQYLDAPQFNQLINEWNNTSKPFEDDKTIQQLFEAQVLKTSDHIALVYEQEKLTYRELNEKANQLAAFLITQHHVAPDDLVALCLHRSADLLIAILGILKAGGAYVPIDPAYPEERINYILQDAQPKVVITNTAHAENIQQVTNAVVIDIDQQSFHQYPVQNPITATNAKNLAYVIYTSGTTGRPKGVMIEHRGVINLITHLIPVHQLDRYERIGCYSNYVFDAFVYEAFPALCNGNTLYVYSDAIRVSPETLSHYISENEISVSFIPPAILTALLAFNPPLQLIFTGGEKLPDLSSYSFGGTIINEYGPTETTVCATLQPNAKNCDPANIGRPIANTTIYLLDANLNPVPAGAPAELYIGGAGVARGYLNNETLTKERFIANPFRVNSRLYKTGDVVKYLPNGDLAYIGRNDLQVKIRGHRIELAEIEARLATHPDVLQAVVVAREQGTGKYLAGYYTATNAIDPATLLHYISAQLPDYMVPTALVQLDAIPLTVNGKTDRQALPDPAFITQDHYQAPNNNIEQQLCEIYSEILGLPLSQISIYDDFFRLGGDSIVSIQLISRLRQRSGIQVTVKDIFKHRTIAALYQQVIAKKTGNTKHHAEQGVLLGEVPLLPIQEWFFHQVAQGVFPDAHHWNQSFLVNVPELSEEILEHSLLQLLRQHDSLRLRYRKEGGQTIQYYDAPPVSITVHYLDIRTVDTTQALSDIFTSWQNNFELYGTHLFQAGYVEGYADGRARLWFSFHHLLIDAVSWRIIIEDLKKIYEQLRVETRKAFGGSSVLTTIDAQQILGEKGSSYRQWAYELSGYKKELSQAHWQALLEGIAKSNALLRNMEIATPAESSLQFGNHFTDLLLREVPHVYNTQINDLLLCSLGMALQALTGNDRHHVLLEGHGREAISENTDLTHTTGWFTSMYPVEIITTQDITDTIIRTKEMLRQVPDNGIGFGAQIGYIAHELPLISFNYLGQFDPKKTYAMSDWYLTGEHSGVPVSAANINPAIISINGAVIDNQLRFEISARISSDALSSLTKNFRYALETIVQHLTQTGRSYLTPGDVEHIIPASLLNKLQASQVITGVYAANSLQQGFIYHALTQGQTDDAYRVQLIFEYHNAIQPSLLQQAWQHVQQQFPTLRLRFNWETTLVQVIDESGTLHWQYADVSDQSTTEQELFISRLLAEDRAQAFDLEAGSLFRIYLIKRNTQHYQCIFSNHHIILDGWSMPVLLQAVHAAYANLSNGAPLTAHPDNSYALAQHYLQTHQHDHEAFWKTYVGRLTQKENLTHLLKESARHTQLHEHRFVLQQESLSLVIADELYKKIKTVCAEHAVTLNAVLQYCWNKQLYLFSESDTTITGVTVSGRNIPVDDIERSAGLYINTLPLIVQHGNGSVIAALQQLQADINEINTRSNIALAQLQPGGERLFSSLFIYENYPELAAAPANNMLKAIFTDAVEKLDYPLSVVAYEHNDNAVFKIKYAGELFSQDTIQQLLNGVSTLLTQISAQPALDTNALQYVDAPQLHQIINEWNDTTQPFQDDKTIQQLFEAQVLQTPGHIALVYEQEKITYRELNEKANQLAAFLIANHQIEPDDLVALCLYRSADLLIAILGILKAGAAYVPIDPAYPEERINYILQDAQPKVVITNTAHAENIQQVTNAVVIDIDQQLFDQYPVQNPVTATNAQHLAYVIYTSGTTGRPKGVMIEHRGVINLITHLIPLHQLTLNQRVGCYSNYVFDAFVYEVFPALCNGNSLYVYSDAIRVSPEALSHYISENEISVSFIPPAILTPLLAFNPPLQLIFTGGEKLPDLSAYSFGGTIINEYGPTETTVCVTLQPNAKNSDPANIGRPIANTTIYLLDANLNPVPAGAPAELYIGGAGVARGYLNNDTLTQERFITNPFQVNSRLYKTGDLVKYLPNGDLAYIGRNDLQVKIRGHRIELAEIEARLATHPDVLQAVVVAREQGTGKYLAGYYTAKNAIDPTTLLQYISAQLPDYMVPAVLVQLDAIPLTVNGKTDRQALSDPVFTTQDHYQAPTNNIEYQLCEIYSEILGLPLSQIGIHDDFFRLGGNSILAIQLVGQVSKRTGKKISIADLFTARTIHQLALQATSGDNGIPAITSSPVADPVLQRLSFAQERLWFLEVYEGGSNAYNIPVILQLLPGTDPVIVTQALREIVHRHEVLRSVIRSGGTDHSYQQVMDDSVYPLPIEHADLYSTAELEEALVKTSNHIFQLDTEYPLQVNHFTVHLPGGETTRYVSIVLHHIAFDGWSTDIFIKELSSLYSHYATSTESPSPLPLLPVQYKDYALWQRDYLSGEVLQKQLDYWKQKLSGFETLHLPTDHPRPLHVNYAGAQTDFELDELLSDQLREIAMTLGVSIYSVLLSGYYLLLSSFSNQQDLIVGSPMSNRHHPAVTGLIGFFVNTLPLREIIDPQQSLTGFIQQVSASVIEAQLHQDLPFEKLVDLLAPDPDTSRHPLFQVIFSVQHFGSDNTALAPLFERYHGSAHYNVAKFDLTTIIDDSGSSVKGIFNYATSLFTPATIGSFIRTYKVILEQIAQTQTGIRIKDLQYLDAATYDEVIYQWNAATTSYPENSTIHQRFEAQVAAHPANIALTFEGQHLSYQSLNEKANKLAAYLQAHFDIQPDELVTLFLDRSPDMIVAILAVLKAGGAYVPMDPAYPAERIAYIVADTRTKVILTNTHHATLLASLPVAVVSVDQEAAFNTYAITNPAANTTPDNLAYVIYTSGTTGQPKGVMVAHRHVTRLFDATDHWYHFSDQDVWVLFHAYVFDFSVWEMWGALLYGGKLLVLTYAQTRDFSLFYQSCLEAGVTILNQTPSAFYQFIDTALQQQEKLHTLRYVIFGGEALNLSQLKPWYKLYAAHSPQLINMYGITETTVHVTYKPIDPGELDKGSLIGGLIPDLSAYILNAQLTPLPPGAIGELYIGGAGVTQGYLNRPDLTATRFLTNPFTTNPPQHNRLYKTGDLARYLPGGQLEYIGRNDFQVKIRGHRIELGEIENRMLTYPGIQQAIVLTCDAPSGAGKYLAGYYVSAIAADHNDLLQYLGGYLPDYMLPAALVHLEKIPLTINGKTDRNRLPQPQFTSTSNYQPPTNDTESALCEIYSGLLNIPAQQVGIYDDFFRLGGNSIMAVRLINKVNLHFKSGLRVADVFITKTVQQLSLKVMEGVDRSKVIVKFNATPGRENIFLIHPANSGCEVYATLSEKLQPHFSCFGIDSYNLYHTEKILDLNKLAAYYLKAIDEVQRPHDAHYKLLGWSMGGQIALEIAAILEERGARHITVYLLDTVLTDPEVIALRTGLDDKMEQLFEEFKITEDLIHNAALMQDHKDLGDQPVSSVLQYTQVKLLKAMVTDERLQGGPLEAYCNHILDLPFNNIDKILATQQQMHLIKMYNKHHGNILDNTDFLLSVLLKP